MAFDPVCNMEVDPDSTEWVSEYKGEKYYFCDEGCKKAFEKLPDMWLSKAQQQSMGGCSCCSGHC